MERRWGVNRQCGVGNGEKSVLSIRWGFSDHFLFCCSRIWPRTCRAKEILCRICRRRRYCFRVLFYCGSMLKYDNGCVSKFINIREKIL